MSLQERIDDCFQNQEKYLGVLTTMPDKELSKKLDLVHIQMEIAERTKNTRSLELLEVWRQQIIEARILKAENQIPDQPSEIELAIADIETVVAKSEDRENLLRKGRVQESDNRKSEPTESNAESDQLSLF